jgi:hypothetical protein
MLGRDLIAQAQSGTFFLSFFSNLASSKDAVGAFFLRSLFASSLHLPLLSLSLCCCLKESREEMMIGLFASSSLSLSLLLLLEGIERGDDDRIRIGIDHSARNEDAIN